jgi:hypothetical protein
MEGEREKGRKGGRERRRKKGNVKRKKKRGREGGGRGMRGGEMDEEARGKGFNNRQIRRCSVQYNSKRKQ